MIYNCNIIEELSYLDCAYQHLLQHMDSASSRFTKCRDAKSKSRLDENVVVHQHQHNYLKTNEDETSSARTDPSSCEKGIIKTLYASVYKLIACAINTYLYQCILGDVDYEAEFIRSVLKKGRSNASTAALNCVRQHIVNLYSSEQETFAQLQIYLDKSDKTFATRLKCMFDNDCDPVIRWMKDSLIPFGKQLLNWCDNGDTLDKSLYYCNGNPYVHD